MFEKLSSLILVGVAGLAWPPGGAAAPEKADKSDEQAKEVAEQFMKALQAQDIEAVMKISEVPFFWDGKKSIQKREELKKELARLLEDEDLAQIQYDIKEVLPAAKAQEKLGEKERRLLKEVLDKNDRILVVTVKFQERQEAIAVMIRIREGKPKVAGFRD